MKMTWTSSPFSGSWSAPLFRRLLLLCALAALPQHYYNKYYKYTDDTQVALLYQVIEQPK
ncbi:hypothetical protein ABFS82_14G137600 [Erythranthe guttata]